MRRSRKNWRALPSKHMSFSLYKCLKLNRPLCSPIMQKLYAGAGGAPGGFPGGAPGGFPGAGGGAPGGEDGPSVEEVD
jgi:hypothetical protein